MGGNVGVKRVEVSADGGKTWSDARLGSDEGRYSFRRFEAQVPVARGAVTLMSRATNAEGAVQPVKANWNPGGYMRNCVEPCPVEIV